MKVGIIAQSSKAYFNWWIETGTSNALNETKFLSTRQELWKQEKQTKINLPTKELKPLPDSWWPIPLCVHHH